MRIYAEDPDQVDHFFTSDQTAASASRPSRDFCEHWGLLSRATRLSMITHKRIHRAYWNHEFAMRSYYLDVKWTLVVSAFEALMNTREEQVRMQFRERVLQLANEFKVSINSQELNDAYTLRSELLYAQKFLYDLETVLPKSKHSPLYSKLELLLRQTLWRCLLDQTFGDFFRDGASVPS